ncbi:MAG TPA: DUF4388 domain-containing protein [Thermoanaerobaculia bacterium]|nr:DUF4388 domain-containing protein [Thermoanaerobaculia bacterium]
MKLEGEIGEIELIGQLVELGETKFTGALRFEHDAIIKIIYFKAGEVLSASTNDRTDSVDEILLRAGKITREHIKQALGKRKDNETLGDAMLALGFITKKELTWGRRAQLIGIIRSLEKWTSGSYTIVNDYLPKRDEGTSFFLPQLLLEMLVTDPDRVKVEQELQSGDAVMTKSEDFEERYASLGLNEEADTIVSRIDGSRSVAEISAMSAKDSFNVFKLIHALRVLGLVKSGEALVEAPALPLAVEDAEAGHEMFETARVPALRIDNDDEPELVDRPIPLTYDDAVLDHGPSEEQPVALDSFEPVIEPAELDRELVAGPGYDEPPSASDDRDRPSRVLIPLLILVAVIAAAGWYWVRWGSPQTSQPTLPGVIATPVLAPTTEFQVSPIGEKREVPPDGQPPAATTPPDTQVRPTMQLGPNGEVRRDPGVATSTLPAPAQPLSPPREGETRESRVKAQEPSGAVPNAGTPTPAAAALPPNQPTRGRYDSMARDFLAKSSADGYAIQFELVCQTSSIQRALDKGEEDVWFVPTKFRGNDCFRLLWGRFATREAALAGLGRLPSSLREESTPAVVKVRR